MIVLTTFIESHLVMENWEVSPQETAKAHEAKEVVLIDCRTAEEHAIASIEGAKLVPMQDVPARLNELEEYLDDSLIVFCHHGMRSMQVTAFLKEQGFKDVRSMTGGIDQWAVEIEPGMARY